MAGGQGGQGGPGQTRFPNTTTINAFKRSSTPFTLLQNTLATLSILAIALSL